jgi:HEAT repeat protein
MNFISYNDAKVRNGAVYALGRLRVTESVPELSRLYQKQVSLPSKDQDEEYSTRLLDALAYMADPSSRDLFVKESRNPQDNLRLHAYEGLARIGDASMVTDISRERLSEKDERIKTAQAYALYRMGRKEYLEEVVRALDSRRSNNEARQYLVELKPNELPELYPMVKIDNVNVREGLAEVFGLIGDAQTVPALQQLSKDRRGQIAALANQALRRINARATP